ISDALSDETDAQTILDEAEHAVFTLAEERQRDGFTHFRPVAERVFEKIREFSQRETNALTGLATGYRDLDLITSGLQPSDLVIVAARPSMGKTALC
ncbi:replicative DNA helicase, partial [Escherichia coli]|nr:replicative DNA helicase [Escherichia coli]